jgi:hypothetical protein
MCYIYIYMNGVSDKNIMLKEPPPPEIQRPGPLLGDPVCWLVKFVVKTSSRQALRTRCCRHATLSLAAVSGLPWPACRSQERDSERGLQAEAPPSGPASAAAAAYSSPEPRRSIRVAASDRVAARIRAEEAEGH